MRVVWVNRSFLDYRVPVYSHLDKLLNGNFVIIFSKHHTPERVRAKITTALGERAVALDGERVLFKRGNAENAFANTSAEICYQPGLLHQIGRWNPSVLIGEGFFKWTAAALAYRLLHGTPLVISYERTMHTERNSQWYRTVYRKLVLKAASGVCCNGRLSAEYVSSLGFPQERISTGAMAADSEALSAQCSLLPADMRAETRKRLALGSPVFLYVGQLIERKGVMYLLKAWQMLHSYGSTSASLLIVGDGPEKTALESFVREESLQNVLFTGAVDYDSIAQYYAIADVFIIPTLEDNWSLVVAEAMTCGLPILCSKYNGCWPELVHHNVNGFVFDPLNVSETALHIKHLIVNPELCHLMGEQSRRIEAQYTPRHAAESFLRVCRNARESAR